MKVSRKVGRRSRCSYSVSRRRLRNKKTKSGYRKKHTHRGGKHGKRGRGHKHARTHKRGKRFHRGGKDWPLFGEPDPVAFEWDKSENTAIIKNLRYWRLAGGKNKKKFDDFIIRVAIAVLNGGKHKNLYNVIFEKVAGESRFSFYFGPYNFNIILEEIRKIIEGGSKFENVSSDEPAISSHSYSFMGDDDLASSVGNFVYTIIEDNRAKFDATNPTAAEANAAAEAGESTP